MNSIPQQLRNFRRKGLLAGMRIRFKLVTLHTLFSLALAAILLLALRPALREVVRNAEAHEARVLINVIRDAGDGEIASNAAMLDRLRGAGVWVRTGTAKELGLADAVPSFPADDTPTVLTPDATTENDGTPRSLASHLWGIGPSPIALVLDPRTPITPASANERRLLAVSVTLAGARDAVVRLYALMIAALLAVYALVAAALEIFVLPRQVYEPIQRMLDADVAVQEGQHDLELIPDAAIPSDELGLIMHSRNRSILALRQKEQALADAARAMEEIAGDLKRKNHLLEMARQNMADADRLASLGLMSAGIAHELNTPLAVLKGLVEKHVRSLSAHARDNTASPPRAISADEAALMLRVVGRLERLSEGLLDFARVRPASTAPVHLRPIVDEAWTLVRLDRDARGLHFINDVPDQLIALCDADRIVQVLVNLIRNAADALSDSLFAQAARASDRPTIHITGASAIRDMPGDWCSITITDNGPGIDPEMLGRLFQPFASTKLDSKGTGLGLGVAEGIVREHGGVLLARNRNDGPTGAIFEIILPQADGTPILGFPAATPNAVPLVEP
ncbi:MAG: hypothetical protein K2W85_03485 [Phycisphaerales bacterium]|nr:hypothetical protein [Phycisphaerales bacterium]